MQTADMDAMDALRSDLLEGDLSGLEKHLAALDGLEARMTERHDPAALAALRAQAERNRNIIAAAAAGVRAALRRLGEAGAPATVYAPDGRRLAIEGPEPATESRA